MFNFYTNIVGTIRLKNEILFIQTDFCGVFTPRRIQPCRGITTGPLQQ